MSASSTGSTTAVNAAVGDGEGEEGARGAVVRAQRVEDREELETDGVPERHEVFRSGSVIERHGELGQPATEAVDGAGALAGETQPRLT